MKQFTLRDTLLASVLLAAILGTALPAWFMSRKTAFDESAAKQLVLLRDTIYSRIEQSEEPLFLHAFNLDSTAALSKILPGIALRKGIHVHSLVRVPRGRSAITLVSVSHNQGTFIHRWTDVYGARRQQKILIEK